MPITDPNAIRFANTRIRVAADLIAQLDTLAGVILAEWNAQNLGATFTNDAEVVVDGSATDGRPVITGAKVNNIINRLTSLRSASASSGLAMGAAGVRDTVLQVAVNPTRGI
jgi:hypothetical protein